MADKAGTVSVELRLMLDTMRRQLKEAQREIKAAVGGSGPGSSSAGTSAADRETAAIERGTRAVKARTSALREARKAALDAWRAGLPAPQVSIYGPGAGGGASGPGPMIGHASTMKRLGFPLLQNQNLSPNNAGVQQYGAPIGPQNQASLRSMFGGLWNAQLSPLAQTAVKAGGALAALRVGLGVLKFAIDLATLPLRVFAQAVMAAAESARALYAKQLRSGGLPMEFVAKRSLLAQAIGVGDDEVLQYGKAVAYLNEKFRDASNIFERTNPELTALSWDWQAMRTELAAIVADIASDVAPALRLLVGFLRVLAESFNTLRRNLMNNLPGVLGILTKGVGGIMSKYFPGAPGAEGNSARMAASPWERMGLVLGVATGNHAAETARNTRSTVRVLESIRAAIGGKGEFGGSNHGFGNPVPSQP